MGDPVSMAVAQAAMSAGSKGMKIAGEIGDGIQKKTAAQIKAVQLQTAAEAARTRALQTDAAYREELAGALQNIDAIRASQNVSLDSPTAAALAGRVSDASNLSRRAAVSNERIKALGLEGDALAAIQLSKQYRTASLLKVLPDVFSIGQAAAGLPGQIEAAGKSG